MENTDKNIIVIDCRELLPPEPLMKIMKATENLGEDEKVLMLHRHEPHGPFFSKLIDRNLDHKISKSEDGSIEILIWRKK